MRGTFARIRGGEPPASGEGPPPVKRPCGPTVTDPFPDDLNLSDADFEQLNLLDSQAEPQQQAEPQRVAATLPRLRTAIAPGPRGSQGPGPWALPVPGPRPAGVVAAADDPPSEGQGSREVEALRREGQSLKDKCTRLQEEVHMREGEARILRESLQAVQAALNEQRVERLKHERDATLAVDQRERDLHKQVEGLKSQMQFKDAETKSLQNRLYVLERGTRSPRSPWGGSGLTTGSPRVGASSPRADSSLGRGTRTDAAEEKKQMKDCGKSQASEDGRGTWVIKRQWSQGALLVDKLLRVPGVCAHLPVSSAARRGGGAVSADADGHDNPGDVRSALVLSLNGLSRLLHPTGPASPLSRSRTSGPTGPRGIDGDLLEWGIVGREAEILSHFLPLIELRLGRYADAALARFTSRSRPGEEPVVVAMETDAEAAAAAAVDALVLEEEAEAALKTLLALLAGAPAPIAKALSPLPQEPETEGGPVREKGALGKIVGDPGAPHPLLKRLVQVLKPCGDGLERTGAVRSRGGGAGLLGGPGRGQREAIVCTGLRVLAQLAENRHGNLTESLLLALEGSGRLARCITVKTPPSTVLQVTRILTAVCCQPRALSLLGCGSDHCTLLHVCTYVCDRGPRGSEPHPDAWLHLQLQLARVVGAMAEAGLVPQLLASPCSCSHEVAKALALSLHRAWLSVREPMCYVGGATRWVAPLSGCKERQTGRVMRELVWGLCALSAGPDDGRFWSLLQYAAHPFVEATRCLRSGLLLQSLLPDYGPADEAALEGLCFNPHATSEQHSHVDDDMEVT
ncbi:ATR-interacting protein isoform X1 [Petromyzon marinus]|uniref:ATR-interacting protein isoform X1 n=1 Tax=Petromyzon marinus TaxID=7757 RepID=UPI003F6E9328